MKKSSFVLPLLLYSILNFAQEKTHIHSVKIGFGAFYFAHKYETFTDTGNFISSQKEEYGGVANTGEIIANYRKNLFGINYEVGHEIPIIGRSQYNFYQTNLLYGKEIEVNKWLHLEAYTGVGYLAFKNESYSSILKSTSTFSVPIKLNTNFYVGNHFSIGLATTYNFNKLNNFSAHLLFNYKL